MAQDKNPTEILRRSTLRVTPGRIAVLNALQLAKHPLTVEELHTKSRSVDLVTIYRILDLLKDKGLVRTVHFKTTAVRYELSHNADHHHHVVCTNCGFIDELPACEIDVLEKRVLRNSSFASITEHTLEFFGSCKSCAAV